MTRVDEFIAHGLGEDEPLTALPQCLDIVVLGFITNEDGIAVGPIPLTLDSSKRVKDIQNVLIRAFTPDYHFAPFRASDMRQATARECHIRSKWFPKNGGHAFERVFRGPSGHMGAAPTKGIVPFCAFCVSAVNTYEAFPVLPLFTATN